MGISITELRRKALEDQIATLAEQWQAAKAAAARQPEGANRVTNEQQAAALWTQIETKQAELDRLQQPAAQPTRSKPNSNQRASARLASSTRQPQHRAPLSSNAPAQVPGHTLHRLSVEEQQRSESIVYRYDLNSPELGLMRAYESPPITGNRHNYVDKLFTRIEQRWSSNPDDFEAELRAFGAELCDELFPPELQRDLWKYRRQLDHLFLVSSEPYIPWELVHLKPPGKGLPKETRFLGQLGLVRWLHNADWPPEQLRIRRGYARYVIPRYPHPDFVLPEAEQEAVFLQQQFGATAVEPQVRAVRELLQAAGTFDLLHFACHAGADPANISDSYLMLQGHIEGNQYIPATLGSTVVGQWSNLVADGQRSMIVLNACQTARAGVKLSSIGGFPDAFVRRGAGMFVGTSWSVYDAPARSFTEALYTRLLAGDTVASATRHARDVARKAGDVDWLAYVVYAHPHATVRR